MFGLLILISWPTASGGRVNSLIVFFLLSTQDSEKHLFGGLNQIIWYLSVMPCKATGYICPLLKTLNDKSLFIIQSHRNTVISLPSNLKANFQLLDVSENDYSTQCFQEMDDEKLGPPQGWNLLPTSGTRK